MPTAFGFSSTDEYHNQDFYQSRWQQIASGFFYALPGSKLPNSSLAFCAYLTIFLFFPIFDLR